MKLPFVTRKEYAKLLKRMQDVERHFVIERDPKTKEPLRTLADATDEERERLRNRPKPTGMSIDQRRRYLEATDGGRIGG